MVTILAAILIIIIVSGVAGMARAVMKVSREESRPARVSGRAARTQENFARIKKVNQESAELNQKKRWNELFEQVNDYHGKRAKSKLKFLRGEDASTIEADRITEIRQLATRLALGRSGHLGSIHPGTGKNHNHGIGRPGIGSRPAPEPRRLRSRKKN